MGKKRGKKTKPKTTAFKQLLFTVCTEPSRQSIPVQRPSGPGATRTHTTETDGPCPPAGQRERRGRAGRPGRCGAEVECRPGVSRSGAGGRGPESPCPQSWEQPGMGTIFLQDLVPPALARGWSRDQHGPICLWQNLSVLVSCCALPAAWGSCPKSKRWMKRGATAPPTAGCAAPGFGGHLP